jgi:hypothetical protein
MAESKYSAWRKASYSDGTGNCVEVAESERLIAIRDTKQGGRGSMLEFGAAAWREFLTAIKDGNTNP